MNDQNDAVFIIYTGGTIGSLPKDKMDPDSPLVPQPLDVVMEMLPTYNKRDKNIIIGKKIIRLGFYSWETPIDSSNIKLTDWIEIAKIIKANYSSYDGFVVLHGTDTLAYTSSALSFILDNLSKPVVITGAQKPIGEARSDAVQNLITSIEIAAARTMGNEVVGEVCVFFRDELYRGCRTSKLSASSYSAFNSPNFPALGIAGEHIVINEKYVKKQQIVHSLQVSEKLEPNIASMDIFPGMSSVLLNNMLNTESLRGVVLQTFGTGNAPSTFEFLDAIKKAVENNRMIVDVTQCRSGEVELGLYDVSAGLLSRGVISGMDMTPEAALTKMFVILGKETDIEKAKDLMQLNLRGEQRQSIFNLHFPGNEFSDDSTSVCIQPIRPMVHGSDRYNPSFLDKAILRIMGIKIQNMKRGNVDIAVFIDLPDANEQTKQEGNPHFIGRKMKSWTSGGDSESIFFDVTKQVKEFVDNRHENSLTIVNMGGFPFQWDLTNIAFFADC